jgi:NADH-quinone oxidoreductase subunit G
MAKVIIDGITVDVPDNSNIIQAAEAAGIHIPHLCYHPKLSLSGTCRLCLVEVEKTPKLQTACSTTVRDGMVVFTNNEKVRKARAGVLEFLLINHPLDCPVCDKAGECKLQDYAYEYGFGKSRFNEEKREYPIVDVGGGLVRNMDRCVHCKRCVRFCREVAGIEEYGPEYRGGRTDFVSFPGSEVTNAYSGALAEICPVGALTSRDFRFKSRVWNLKQHFSICPGCSAGCPVILETKGNRILRVRPQPGNVPCESWLCNEGRFGYHFIEGKERIVEPVARLGAKMEPASFEAAVTAAAAGLKKVLDAHGPDAVAGLCGAHAANEDALAFLRLVNEALKSNNHDYKLGGAAESDSAVDFVRRTDPAPNTRGLQLLGVGADPAGSGEKLMEKIRGGSIKALIAVDMAAAKCEITAPGIGDALAKLECLVVIDILPSVFTEAAHVILPGAAFAEKAGTFTNYAGRIGSFERALRPPKGARPEWETLAAIAKALGADFGYKDIAGVTADATARIEKHTKVGAG